jgi:hypothetical protein
MCLINMYPVEPCLEKPLFALRMMMLVMVDHIW